MPNTKDSLNFHVLAEKIKNCGKLLDKKEFEKASKHDIIMLGTTAGLLYEQIHLVLDMIENAGG